MAVFLFLDSNSVARIERYVTRDEIMGSESNGAYSASQMTWQRYTSSHGIHGNTLKKAFFYGYIRALPWPALLVLGLR